VDISATPAAGYVFDHWSGACAGSGACQVTMDAAKSVAAHFVVSIDVSIAETPLDEVELSWQHQAAGVDHYAVYRSLTAPYFAPDAGSWLDDVTPSGTPSTVTFPDPDADLSVAGNTYFYAVVPMNASDEPMGSGNRTGAFVYGLVPGTGP
jgi:hypothetical protein